jgi:hypothetical protein
LFLCIVIVAAASLFSRSTGACGTAHYVFFQLLGGAIVSMAEEIWASRYDELIARGLAVTLNVALYVLLIRAWYLKGPRRWYLPGLLLWTSLYVVSYFFFFPTRDCP